MAPDTTESHQICLLWFSKFGWSHGYVQSSEGLPAAGGHLTDIWIRVLRILNNIRPGIQVVNHWSTNEALGPYSLHFVEGSAGSLWYDLISKNMHRFVKSRLSRRTILFLLSHCLCKQDNSKSNITKSKISMTLAIMYNKINTIIIPAYWICVSNLMKKSNEMLCVIKYFENITWIQAF